MLGVCWQVAGQSPVRCRSGNGIIKLIYKSSANHVSPPRVLSFFGTLNSNSYFSNLHGTPLARAGDRYSENLPRPRQDGLLVASKGLRQDSANNVTVTVPRLQRGRRFSQTFPPPALKVDSQQFNDDSSQQLGLKIGNRFREPDSVQRIKSRGCLKEVDGTSHVSRAPIVSRARLCTRSSVPNVTIFGQLTLGGRRVGLVELIRST